MTPNETLAELRRYAGIIQPITASARSDAAQFDAEESATAVQVERGVIFARALSGSLDPSDHAIVERLIELSRSPRLGELAIVDQAGHHRVAYRGLLVHSWLQTFRMVYETLPRAEFGRWEEATRAWCDMLEAELGEIELPRDVLPAQRGDSATEAAMIALALHVAGKVFVRDAWIDLASFTFGRLTQVQRSNGSFLLAGAADNPETRWFHELVLLHAAASYAVQAEDRTIAAAVARGAEFHLAETQPDHATNQPWALFAFIWNPRTRPLADQMLHSTLVNASGTPGGISLMLMADALYCLRLFFK